MLKLIILTFFALTAIWEVSAQSETCTLKAENAQVSIATRHSSWGWADAHLSSAVFSYMR
jgi:hypothetical protein